MNLRTDKFFPAALRSGKLTLCLVALGLMVGAASAAPGDSPRARLTSLADRPLSFEPNQGQHDATAAFVSRGPNYHLELTPTEVRVTLQKAKRVANHPLQHPGAPGQVTYRSLRIELLGADAQARMLGEGEIAGRANYFIGNDPAKWLTGVPTYDRVRVSEVYPGINLLHYGNQQQLEYDFEIAPGTNPGVIAMRFTGADKIAISAGGDLVLTLGLEEIRQPKPVIYQTVRGQRKEITGGYVLSDPQTVEFALGDYDHRLPLVIDPVVSYWKFINVEDEVDNDFVWAVAIGSDGDVYLAGETLRPGLATTNAYQTNLAGVLGRRGDVFVTRQNNDISSRVYYTYLGGAADETALGLAVDAAGNAYLTGFTGSTNFPTSHAVQPNIAGSAPPGYPSPAVDCFITKIGPYGSNLVFSTFYGGSGTGYGGIGDDVGNGIALDTNNNVFVAGYTHTTNFPTINTSLTNAGGLQDGFVVKLDSSGTNVIYALRFGGANGDYAHDLAVDHAGSPVVIGRTASSDFPVNTNALQAFLNGTTNLTFAEDAFISKFAATNGTLTYSTFLGGTNDDRGLRLALDTNGAAYVTGWTGSPDFPRTLTNFPSPVTTNASTADVFVVKLNPNHTNLDYAITFGGSGKDEARDVAVDGAGQAHVVGTTESANFPTNAIFGFLSGSLAGSSDAFLAEINSDGTAFVYSGYLGGDAADFGYAVDLDAGGNSYFVGEFNKDPFIIKMLVDVALAIASEGTNVNVSWPGYAAEFNLEARSDLLGTNSWQTITNSSVFTNNLHVVTLPATNAASFFRLTK